jgi:tetratricopeptide (TPR) repeat protein
MISVFALRLYPLACFGLLAVFLLPFSRAADTSASTAEKTVELPALNVTDKRDLPPPEPWRYTRIEGFEVISNASDRETRKLLQDFEIFRLALGIAWPVKLRPLPPAALILCGRKNAFDRFAPSAQRTNLEVARVSTILRDREQSFIVMDLQSKAVSVQPDALVDTATAGFGSSEMEVDHYKQLYREYVRYLLSHAENPSPVWFEEGLAQIIMRMKFDERMIIFGQISPASESPSAQALAANANAASAATAINPGDSMASIASPADTAAPTTAATVEDRDFNVALYRRRLLDFESFFSVARDSIAATNPLGNNVWAKQAYGFVHMCLYGRGGKFKKPFEAFLQRSAREPVTEAMFQECFGLTYKKMLSELRGYIDMTDYQYQQFNIKGANTLTAPLPEMRDATEGESARIKADALRLAGNVAAARADLSAAYLRGERDPQFLATFGLAEAAAGENERARKFLEAAVAAKTTRASVHLELARLRFAEASAKPAGAEKQFSAAQLTEILQPLFTARRLPPPDAEVYELIAQTWLRSEVDPKPEHLAVLVEGMKLFPRDAELFYLTAALYARIQIPATAHGLIDYALKITRDEAQRARLTNLKASLPPAPPAPAETPAKRS